MKNDVVILELQRICEENDGLLIPEKVVEEASDENSPLHDKFTWDNSIAGHQWRLWQARQLIRVSVVYEQKTETSIRAFVSLTTDRKEESGGYRSIVQVLSNKNMKAQMLEDAMEELKVFESKYKTLKELSVVFKAIRKVKGNNK